MKLKGADQSWIKSPSLSMNVVKDYFFGLLKLSIDSSWIQLMFGVLKWKIALGN